MDEVLRAAVTIPGEDAEKGLVEAAVGGDAQAFAALYDQHVDRVYRHVYYWVNNRAEAEDFTQQAFLNAWQAIGRYRYTGVPFIAWLLKIAHNLVLSHYRKAKETSCEDMALVSEERWANPEAETLAKYDRAVVRNAILLLRPDQQRVITMRFIEHFGYSEIAAIMGKSEGAVRVLQHRALAELRRMLVREVGS